MKPPRSPIRLRIRLLAGLFVLSLALPAVLPAQDNNLFDWVLSTDKGYALLAQGVDQAKMQSWLVERMRTGQPLPQASARDLAAELIDSPKVDAQLKQDLKQAFPPETASFVEKTPDLLDTSEAIRKRLDALEPRLQAILEAKDRNNYGPLSTPKAQISVGSYFKSGNYHLLAHKEYAEIEPSLYSNTIKINLLGNVGNATWSFNMLGVDIPYNNSGYLSNPAYSNFTPGNVLQTGGAFTPPPLTPFNRSFTLGSFAFIGSSSLLKVHFDPPGFENLDVGVGSYYLTEDDLIYASPGIPTYQPFFSNDVISSEESEIYHATNRAFSGVIINKTGSSGWWFFSHSNLLFAPAFYPGASDQLVGRFELRGIDIPWLIEDSLLWTSFSLSGVPQSLAATPVHYQDDHDYSLGISGQVPGGGFASLEWAIANWSSQGPQPEQDGSALLVTQGLTWQDQALRGSWSKSFPWLTLTLQGAQVGPQYITGPRHGIWGDLGAGNQNGNYIDTTVDDPRPGKKGTTTWQTVTNGFDWITNNAQRLDLTASWSNAWLNLGLGGGFNSQIQPSGPWITTSRYLNNRSINGHDWFDTLGGQYSATPPGSTGSPLAAYNKSTRGKAYYQGKPVTTDYFGKPLTVGGEWNWDDLQGLGYLTTQENILLSQNGVGDFNLREDSVKTVNELKLTCRADFQAMLHSYLPLLLQGYSEIRDTAEAVRPATYSDQSLLAQAIHEYYLTVGVADTVNLLGYAGYETWLSRASAFPIDTEDDSYGVGFDLLLSKLLSGLTVGSRYKWMDHRDANFPTKEFHGYTFNVGANIVY